MLIRLACISYLARFCNPVFWGVKKTRPPQVANTVSRCFIPASIGGGSFRGIWLVAACMRACVRVRVHIVVFVALGVYERPRISGCMCAYAVVVCTCAYLGVLSIGFVMTPNACASAPGGLRWLHGLSPSQTPTLTLTLSLSLTLILTMPRSPEVAAWALFVTNQL